MGEIIWAGAELMILGLLAAAGIVGLFWAWQVIRWLFAGWGAKRFTRTGGGR